MKNQLSLLILVSVALVSCEKVKTLADKASTAVKEQIDSKKKKAQAPTTESALQKLVDQTPEGVIFRKDLHFPEQLEVTVTRHREMSGRFSQASADEKQADVTNGTLTEITKVERMGNQIRVMRLQSDGIPPGPFPSAVPEKEKPAGITKFSDRTKPANKSKPADSIKDVSTQAVTPASNTYTLRKSGKTWKSSDGGNMATAHLSKQLAPVFDQLLVESSVYTRRFWFAKRRLKIGDQLDISGEGLPMLKECANKGSFHLKLVALESVEGHPCGVFEVTGDYSCKQVPNFDGEFTDEDVSVQSGKLWLSLLYPIILKGELDTIQTLTSGANGGHGPHGQGAVKESFTHAWKVHGP